MKERIQLSDTMATIITKLSEGNPGAISVCIKLITENEKIDPDSTLAYLSSLLLLDSLGIYGSNIWILYKDICNQNINYFIAILRAFQLGFLSQETLLSNIQSQSPTLNILPYIKQVKQRLPNFKTE